MKSTAINTLNYTGIVTLSQCIGNKKIKIAQIHNEGGNPLFDFFADCLTGDYESARTNRPVKIMLLKRTSDDGKYVYERKSDYIYITTPAEKVYDADLVGSKVRYSFIVTREKLENIDFNCVGLYPSSEKDDITNYAAICSTTDYEISPGFALLIDWELIMSNK